MEMKMEIESTNAIEISTFLSTFFMHRRLPVQSTETTASVRVAWDRLSVASQQACMHTWHSCWVAQLLQQHKHIGKAAMYRTTAGSPKRPTHRHPLSHSELSARRSQCVSFQQLKDCRAAVELLPHSKPLLMAITTTSQLLLLLLWRQQ